MRENRSYSYKDLKNKAGLKVHDEIVIPAFDAVASAWLKDLKKKYSTYKDGAGTTYLSVKNFIVRMSFKEENMDCVDHDEVIMMKTHVFMYADDKAPLDELMNDFENFMGPCNEESLKMRAVMQMKKRNIKTYHLSRKLKDYYGLSG